MNQTFDPQAAITTIKRFLSGQLDRSGLTGYVVGLSGGIDSALATALAVAAVGPERVFALLMPYRTSSASSAQDAQLLIRQLGIEYDQVDISPMIDAYFGDIDLSARVRAGNKMARERMSILFDYAHKMNRLVLGTGNRTEICLGYTTIYGDSACSVNPIGELYKTQVRQLARAMAIPETIICKVPTADLWADQTDEGEIGVSYDEIDCILEMIVENDVRSMKALVATGLDPMNVSRVVSLMNRNVFKRHLPPFAPLGRGPVPDYVHLEE
jgi:NAD+ synthase